MGPGSHTAGRMRASLLAFVVLTSGSGVALAEPWVQVTASTRLELHSARRADGVRVRGLLLDDLDAPVADARVELRVRGVDDASFELHRTLTTAQDGAFRIELPLHAGRFELRAHFVGEGLYSSATAEHEIDLARADVRLTFVEPDPRRVDLDQDSAPIAVRASSARGGAGLAMVIEDDLGRELARGETDAAGFLRVEVPTSLLGPVGMGKLVAHTRADGQRGAGQAEVALLRARRTQLELLAERSTDGTQLSLKGTLATRAGPLGDKAIGIFDHDVHVVTILTDARGHFAHGPLSLLALDGAAQEALHLQARFDSDAPWYLASESETLVVPTVRANGPSPWWLALPIALCGLLTWWLSRGTGERHVRETLPPAPGTRVGIETGAGVRGRASQHHVGGRAVSADHGRPLPDAQVELIAQDAVTVHTLRPDADGRFRSGELGTGPWTLRVVAPGHAPVAQQLTVPHRGEWSAVTARLQNLRSEALRAFEPIAQHELGTHDGVELVTPREVVAYAEGRGRATGALRALVAKVEHIAFGPTVPQGVDVEAVADAARELEAREDQTRHAP